LSRVWLDGVIVLVIKSGAQLPGGRRVRIEIMERKK
jgi:hypothetical protein